MGSSAESVVEGKWTSVQTVQSNPHREREKEFTLKSWKGKNLGGESGSESPYWVSVVVKAGDLQWQDFEIFKAALKILYYSRELNG